MCYSLDTTYQCIRRIGFLWEISIGLLQLQYGVLESGNTVYWWNYGYGVSMIMYYKRCTWALMGLLSGLA